MKKQSGPTLRGKLPLSVKVSAIHAGSNPFLCSFPKCPGVEDKVQPSLPTVGYGQALTTVMATSYPFAFSSLLAAQSLAYKMAKDCASPVSLGCCAQHQGLPTCQLLAMPWFLPLVASPWNVCKRNVANSLRSSPHSSAGQKEWPAMDYKNCVGTCPLNLPEGNGQHLLGAVPPICCWSLIKGSGVGNDNMAAACPPRAPSLAEWRQAK